MFFFHFFAYQGATADAMQMGSDLVRYKEVGQAFYLIAEAVVVNVEHSSHTHTHMHTYTYTLSLTCMAGCRGCCSGTGAKQRQQKGLHTIHSSALVSVRTACVSGHFGLATTCALLLSRCTLFALAAAGTSSRRASRACRGGDGANSGTV